jgi:hypothetical protein
MNNPASASVGMGAGNAPAVERRASRRISADGQIAFERTDLPGLVLEGSLMELSGEGFRFSHTEKDLRSGERILAAFPWARVEAKVIWTLMVGDRIESGCMFLAAAAQAGS